VNFDNSFSVRAARWPAVTSALAGFGLISKKSADLVRVANARNIRFANATVRIPCPTGSAEAVYCSHMIEHLDRVEAYAFMGEVHRILRPGGVVRIAAPDVARLVEGYLVTGDADYFIAGTHMGLTRPTGLMARARWALVGPRHHLWMYDGESLRRLLNDAGFAEAAVMPPGKTTITDPGALDLEERAAESVYAEAVRPA
jgi:SAM-dependent methyltransferase